MTDTNSLGDVNSQNQGVTPVVSNNSTPISAPQGQTQEKMLPQSEVTAIAGRSKQEGYEKAMREMAEKYGSQSQNAQSQPSYVQSQQSAGQLPVNQVPPPAPMASEEMEKKMQEIAQRTLQQNNYNAAINNFYEQFNNKILQARQKNPAFEQVERDLNLAQLNQSNRELVIAVGLMDNADEVLTDLRDNPHKLATLLPLTANPATQNLALQEIKKLSDSIKNNNAAKSQKTPNDPLSQIKPSVNGADNSPLTVAEIKRMDMYRV